MVHALLVHSVHVAHPVSQKKITELEEWPEKGNQNVWSNLIAS